MWRGMIPPTIVQTGSRPDLVLVDSVDRTVWLLELTVSFQTNFDAGNQIKKDRYASLSDDIEDENWKCNNLPFVIGSKGHISLSNKAP